MDIIKPGIIVDFISRMRTAFIISAVLIAIAVISLFAHKGLNWGVEFIGGTEVHIKFKQNINTQEIKDKLAEINYTGASVQSLGLEGDNEYIVRLSSEEVKHDQIKDFQKQIEGLVAAENAGKFKNADILRIDFIGPKVGKELIKKAVGAIIFGWLGILIYVMLRFEIGFALGAVLAIIHDIFITLGAISILDKEFNLAIVAAFLTVIGYSVNDTIVIFDRIRENMSKGYSSFTKLINESVSQTLSRTVLTTLTALIVLACLFVFGGSVIHDFAYTLIVGVIAGTYSSIFVASAFVVYWNKNRQL
ncbi:MAG: protein translocase subunit SecF [Candidatus Dadabacteria bacterium]|nr:protein translocase subunit SecF [Candidatus Dadabacteria bacterium]NIS10180.1 protein translocase subunit SecF [Candidatus Dadabacteria bacterium]NIY23092.1 protein translocase subunit SecF [Candidatus Dadabacteria bacterium]